MTGTFYALCFMLYLTNLTNEVCFVWERYAYAYLHGDLYLCTFGEAHGLAPSQGWAMAIIYSAMLVKKYLHRNWDGANPFTSKTNGWVKHWYTSKTNG